MDYDIVKKAIKGNKQAFSIITRENKEKAYKIAYCYLKNEQDALDAISNSVLLSFKHIKKLKQPEYFTTWYIRIVINECKKILAEKKDIVDFNEYSNQIEVYDQYENIDLKKTILLLPELDRMIIYLKYYQGYTLEEIATILNEPSGTIKSRLYRRLKELKEQLVEKGEALNE